MKFTKTFINPFKSNTSPLSDRRLATLVTLLVFTGMFAQACNPTGDKDEHQEPFGLVLLQSGLPIATQNGATLTYGDRDHIHRVMEQEFPLVTLRFIDEDGDQFVPDEPAYSLEWTIADGSIIKIDQHQEDGKWSFHIDPLSEGMTTIVLKLMHDGHSDFQSLPLMVKVHEATYGM